MDLIEAKQAFIRRHPWELARLEILLSLIDMLVPRKGQQKVLDIGCGDCFFAQELLKKRTDLMVIGVDTAYTVQGALKKSYEVDPERFKLFTSLQEAKEYLGSATIRLVLLLDVVEHIKHDVAFLKEVTTSRFTNPKTAFLITVPAFQTLYSRHDRYLKHFRRYTIKSLQKTVTAADLLPVTSRYFFSSLVPVRLFQKLREAAGLKQKEQGIGNWKQPSLITSLLKKILLFDYQITKRVSELGITIPGLSLYCICKKSE